MDRLQQHEFSTEPQGYHRAVGLSRLCFLVHPTAASASDQGFEDEVNYGCLSGNITR
jgi:hypothetical protein